MKRCSRCKQTKPLDEFNRQTSSKDGHQAECKRCKFERKCISKGVDPSSLQEKVRGVNHQYSRTPLYRKWKAMRARCDSSYSSNYKWYGGKGISYSPEWSTWEPFRQWAMATGYVDGLELDREDADKDYSPENCRWMSKRDNIKAARRMLPEEFDKQLRIEADSLGVSVDTLVMQILIKHVTETSVREDGSEVN